MQPKGARRRLVPAVSGLVETDPGFVIFQGCFADAPDHHQFLETGKITEFLPVGNDSFRPALANANQNPGNGRCIRVVDIDLLGLNGHWIDSRYTVILGQPGGARASMPRKASNLTWKNGLSVPVDFMSLPPCKRLLYESAAKGLPESL